MKHKCTHPTFTAVKIILIVIVTSLPVVAIGQITAPNPMSLSANSLQPPGPGSYFKYKHWYTTETDKPNGPHIHTRTVIDRGVTFAGKTNVLIYQLRNEDKSRELRINYEPNGDISEYRGTGGPGWQGGWERIPLHSRDTIVWVSTDTVKNGVRQIIVDTLSYIETKDTVIESNPWRAIKIRHIVTNGGDVLNNEIDWYDAKTGWYIRMDLPPRHPKRPGLPTNEEEVHVFEYKINP